MQFKNAASAIEWDELLADVHTHDQMVWQAVCFAVDWVFHMEKALSARDYIADEEFGDMVEEALHQAHTDLTYKQLIWALTWVKRCWKWGDRIVSTRLF